ncbi:PREDICTED: uncharacterized protein C6orf222 homolog [Chrysochloris asiatica]|uniref:Uncharacterized protein C6orf222 homolog n=1 Tax=Chrysochloris asiatica TaxID=185453 RepID=A0A9B0TAT5_CHRAS|nr:PREDICTED: uncharacterized protein C6orf222 homolog [Chrysochloris asiatica]
MKNLRGLRKNLSDRRAGSPDRSQDSRKDSESWDCQCVFLHTDSSQRVLRRTASDGARYSESPVQPLNVPSTMTVALTPEETDKFIPSEQMVSQDTKKEKAHRRPQSGWLKTLLNFFMRTNPEESKEKASKRPVEESLSPSVESPVTPGEPAIRKKSHDKRASCRKTSGHKKPVAEETKRTQDQEAAGQEAKLATSHPEEIDLSSAQKDEAIFQMIVEFLKKVGDEWEEKRLKTQKLDMVVQNPASVVRKKSSEKRSSFRKVFSHKKHSSEESRRAGAAAVSSLEARPSKKPSFLPLCGGGHRPSISSNTDLEEPQVPEALSTAVKDSSPTKLTPGTGNQGPEDELHLDQASEFGEFIQKIFALLEDAKESGAEKRLQTQQSEVAVENPTSATRRKPPEKRSTLRRAFSHKKHSSKEPKRAGPADASSLEVRPPKRPSFLPLCVGGHRPSTSDSLDLEDVNIRKPSSVEWGLGGSLESPTQTKNHNPEGDPQLEGACESKELIIQKLVVLLREVDGQLGKQIRRHPSFKRVFYKLSNSSLRKLAATLQSQGGHSPVPGRNLEERRYQFAADLVSMFAGNNSHTVRSLMGPRGPYSRHTYAQFPTFRTQLKCHLFTEAL